MSDEQIIDLKSQAPECKVLGTHQFVSRYAVLTADVTATNLSLRLSHEDGRALVMEFGPDQDEVLDYYAPLCTWIKPDSLIELLDAILNAKPWVGSSYTVNSFAFRGMTAKNIVAFTAPSSVADSTAYVSIWFEMLPSSPTCEAFNELVLGLLVYHKRLYQWATQYAAQLDCSIEEAFSALISEE